MANKKRKILLVEDETAMLSALVDKFSKEDLIVLSAPDGEAGLDLALKEKPDLIMMDVVMPKMDGLSVLKALRDDDWGRDATCILLTNMNDPMLVAEAAKVGVYDFLVKTDWRLDDVVKLAREKLDNLPSDDE